MSFLSRSGLSAVSQRDKARPVAERDNLDRHGEGALRAILPEATNHGLSRRTPR